MSSILFIAMMNGAPWGGSEELWFAGALEAARQGHKVGCVVYDWADKKPRMKVLEDAGCTIYYIPNKGRQKKTFRDRVENKITKWKRIPEFLNALPVEEYDLVILNQGYFEITLPVWKNFYKRLNRFVLVYHNYKEKERIKKSKAKILREWISRASVNLFASARIGQVLEERLSMKIPNGKVLINPINFEPPRAYTPFPPLQDGNFRMVVVAALDVTRKAQDKLVLALSGHRWLERNWTLHFYGAGRDEKKLKKLVKKKKLSNKIFFEGHVKDVRKALEEAHILLQITHIDAMPLAVVEALAVSRPVVVSKIGDMPEWSVFNNNGWVCQDASPEEIDRIMSLAWACRDDWHKMGRKSFDLFREKFPASPAKYFLEQAGLNSDKSSREDGKTVSNG